jgi:hypothetical protein
MLRKIFGPKRKEITGWSKLHGKEFHDLYSPSNNIRVIK